MVRWAGDEVEGMRDGEDDGDVRGVEVWVERWLSL